MEAETQAVTFAAIAVICGLVWFIGFIDTWAQARRAAKATEEIAELLRRMAPPGTPAANRADHDGDEFAKALRR